VSSESKTMGSHSAGTNSPDTLMKWRLPRTAQQRFIAVGFLTACLIFAFLFVVTYRASTKFMEWNTLATRTRAILASLNDFSQSVKNAQLAAVSYYTGGPESQVQAFSAAQSEAHDALAKARSLSVNSDLQHKMDALVPIADQGLDLLSRVIQLRKDGKSGPEAMKPINDDARKISPLLAKTLSDTVSGENRLLESRSNEATTAALRARLFETIGGSFALALLVVMGILFLRENSIRANAFDRLEQVNLDLGSAVAMIRDENKDRLAAEAALSKLNAELEERVHNRTAELEAANKELEAFCYAVSHDLRAPLRSIDGFSLALLDDEGDRLSDGGKDYLQRVRAATVRMGTLIDDLLDLSRITRSEMHREPVDLSQLAGSIASELSVSQPNRDVDFVIAPGLQANGDSRLIRIAMQNLLGNSWKFTSKRDHARIEFGRTQANGSSSFFVADNGAGFDPTYSARLFGAFQRLHSPADFPGTGVGLATVQRIVHRHGGDIWATGAVNQGAQFFFTFEPRHHKRESA
jgi:signal transduction histidine kinase